MTNLLIAAVTVIFLFILFMLTMLNVLHQYKNKMDAAWDELDKLWVRRRDIVPYLLENTRTEDPRWKALKNKRIELLKNNIPKKERVDLEDQLENAIAAMIVVAREHDDIRRNTNFLEAEKDLRKDILTEIEGAKKIYEEAKQEYDDKSGEFPYIMAAKLIR